MKKIILFILFLFLILFDAFTYAHTIQNEIADNVIRLHIIANSDDELDQNLKLKVRDAILKYMNSKDFKDYTSACNNVSNNLADFNKIATSTLRENNCYKNVRVEFKECLFPQKKYDFLTFPSGKYMALRIIIGDGDGHNWWCVMYPTLCFSETICLSNDAGLTLKESLSKESFSIIANKSKFKFKIVELFN